MKKTIVSQPKKHHWTDPLRGIACDKGIEEGQSFPTFVAWWRATKNPAYLLWLLANVGYPPNVFRRLAYRCIRETRLAENTTPDNVVWDLLNDRSRRALEVAERYNIGQATPEEFKKARRVLRDVLRKQQTICSRGVSTMVAEIAFYTISIGGKAPIAGINTDGSITAVTSCILVLEIIARAVGMNKLNTTPGPVVSRALSIPAEADAWAQQADIIREAIPVNEVKPLFRQFILRIQKEKQHDNQ